MLVCIRVFVVAFGTKTERVRSISGVGHAVGPTRPQRGLENYPEGHRSASIFDAVLNLTTPIPNATIPTKIFRNLLTFRSETRSDRNTSEPDGGKKTIEDGVDAHAQWRQKEESLGPVTRKTSSKKNNL
ncbi:hypothetical protein NDU88_012203 [Pleurodeles waltl]|uniref:Uncharacterized protein n=1 Tax=Pleurodeles waltl TaxID=8319 RepID=A0AAV7R0Z5_PLEWA|nr:hypothetical protein NDU88_012203 [Pleurodeles waltl]